MNELINGQTMIHQWRAVQRVATEVSRRAVKLDLKIKLLLKH